MTEKDRPDFPAAEDALSERRSSANPQHDRDGVQGFNEAQSFSIEASDQDPQPDVDWETAGAFDSGLARDASDLSDLRAIAQRLRPNASAPKAPGPKAPGPVEASQSDSGAPDQQDSLDAMRWSEAETSETGYEDDELASWDNPFLRAQSQPTFESYGTQDQDDLADCEDTPPHTYLEADETAAYHDELDLSDGLYVAEPDTHVQQEFEAGYEQPPQEPATQAWDFGDPDLGRARDKAQLKVVERLVPSSELFAKLSDVLSAEVVAAAGREGQYITTTLKHLLDFTL